MSQELQQNYLAYLSQAHDLSPESTPSEGDKAKEQSQKTALQVGVFVVVLGIATYWYGTRKGWFR